MPANEPMKLQAKHIAQTGNFMDGRYCMCAIGWLAACHGAPPVNGSATLGVCRWTQYNKDILRDFYGRLLDREDNADPIEEIGIWNDSHPNPAALAEAIQDTLVDMGLGERLAALLQKDTAP